MDNDQYSAAERAVSRAVRHNEPVSHEVALMLLKQLQANAAQAVRVHKRLVDAERGLALLERIRGHKLRSALLNALRFEADLWSSLDEEGESSDLFEALDELLRGEGGAR